MKKTNKYNRWRFVPYENGPDPNASVSSSKPGGAGAMGFGGSIWSNWNAKLYLEGVRSNVAAVFCIPPCGSTLVREADNAGRDQSVPNRGDGKR